MIIRRYTYHGYILLAGLTWSTLGVFSQYLVNAEVDLFSQVFWRMVVAIVGSLMMVLVMRQRTWTQAEEVKYITINALLFVLAYTTFPLAIYLGVPIARAIIIVYTYPLVTVPVSFLILGDKPTKRTYMSMGIMALSLLVLFQVWHVGFGGISLGDGIALLNAVMAALVVTWGAKIRRETKLPVGTTLFNTFLVAVPILCLFGWILSRLGIELFLPVLEISFGMAWWYLVGIGLLPTVLSVGLLYAGSKRVAPNVAGILMSSELLWTVILGWLLFGQTLDWATIVGGIGILLAVLLV
jgi:drug/metabolite transporter, DME family